MKRIAAIATIATAVLFAKAAKLETLHEGRRTHVYDNHDGSPIRDGVRARDGAPCIGHPTVGVGCNLDRSGAREALAAAGADYAAVRTGHATLTEAQIDALFRANLEHAMAGLRRTVPSLDELPEVVQLVLLDMSFNMGSVAGFPRMLQAVRRHDWKRMIAEMVASAWYRQVPSRAKHDVELVRQQLDVNAHPQPLTSDERAKVLAMIAITTDTTIADLLASPV